MHRLDKPDAVPFSARMVIRCQQQGKSFLEPPTTELQTESRPGRRVTVAGWLYLSLGDNQPDRLPDHSSPSGGCGVSWRYMGLADLPAAQPGR